MENEIERIVPLQLYSYPKDLDDEILIERTKVVKDFCFPNGVEVIKLQYNPD